MYSRSRRWSVPALVRELAPKHPEIMAPVTMKEALAIAAREGIRVAIADLPRRIRGRLIRVGDVVWIRIARHVPANARHVVIMHELAHFFRDDPGEMAAYMDDETFSRIEEFCDVFAWAVTSPARAFVIPSEEPPF